MKIGVFGTKYVILGIKIQSVCFRHNGFCDEKQTDFRVKNAFFMLLLLLFHELETDNLFCLDFDEIDARCQAADVDGFVFAS